MDREPPGFFAANPVSFPVVRAPSREFGSIFKVARVPITLRVAAGGKVESPTWVCSTGYAWARWFADR